MAALPHLMHVFPAASALPNGMLRIVACVSVLMSASHVAVPHHGDTMKPAWSKQLFPTLSFLGGMIGRTATDGRTLYESTQTKD